jgi:hypothetical protein
LLGVKRDETREDRAAEVPARGLLDETGGAGEEDAFEMDGTRAVNRRPVLMPITCEKGE